MQHPILFHEDSDAASEVRMAHFTNRTRTEAITVGKSTFDAAPQHSTGNTDSFEIPETPSATEKMRCPVHPSVMRVMDERLDLGRPQYLVLCWMYPPEGEAANPANP
jgi:hypothetical protein